MKVVKMPAKYVMREKWMTKCLLQSSLNLHNMRKRKTGKPSSNVYKSYRIVYNRLVRIAKTMHYTALIDRCKGDIAHTWQVLNDITGKSKKKVNFVILLTLIIYPLMIPIQSVMHFVIILLISDSNVPQR